MPLKEAQKMETEIRVAYKNIHTGKWTVMDNALKTRKEAQASCDALNPEHQQNYCVVVLTFLPEE